MYEMLLSIGKPLVDVVATVDKQFLSRYGLSANGAKQASENEINIFKDILELNPKILPGGSVTNTLRVFKWASQNAGDVLYIGLIGRDHLGSIIKHQLNKENIRFHFFEQNETVQCAVLVTECGKNRSLVTNSLFLSNIGDICMEFYDDIRAEIDRCSYFYAPIFSLGSFSKQVKEVAEDFRIKKKKIIVNLGTTYMLQKFVEASIYLFKIADVVIGNEEEYNTLAKICNVPQSSPMNLEYLIYKASSLNNDNIHNNNKVLIITSGSDKVLSYTNSEVKRYPVETVENVVDTTGAGDAFAGGFLANYVKGLDLDACIECGIKYARDIIQVFGCDIDNIKNKTFIQ